MLITHSTVEAGDRVSVCDPSLTINDINYYGRTGTVTGRAETRITVVFDGETRHSPREHEIADAQLEVIDALPDDPTDMAVLMDNTASTDRLRETAIAQFGHHQAAHLLTAAAARSTTAEAARRTRRAFCDIPDLLRRIEKLHGIGPAELNFAYDCEQATEIRSRIPRITAELRELVDALGLHRPDLDGTEEEERAA